MATVKQCDKCGKIIGEETTYLFFHHVFYHRVTAEPFSGYKRERFDLCHECGRKMIAYLKQKKGEQSHE